MRFKSGGLHAGEPSEYLHQGGKKFLHRSLTKLLMIDTLRQIISYHNILYHIILYYITLYHLMLYSIVLCYIHYIVLCYMVLCQMTIHDVIHHIILSNVKIRRQNKLTWPEPLTRFLNSERM